MKLYFECKPIFNITSFLFLLSTFNDEFSFEDRTFKIGQPILGLSRFSSEDEVMSIDVELS